MGAEARCRLSRSTAAGRKPARIAAVLFVAALAAGVGGGAAGAGEWGPWPAGVEVPVLTSAAEDDRTAATAPASDAEGPCAVVLVALVRAYQAWLAPVYGTKCRMLPSCSRYAVDAIRKHGPFPGTVMASGRLMHEPDEWRFAPIRVLRDGHLFFDPVENNDFWFTAR